MSPTQTLISVEEYLSTSYRPDCDYIDGKVQERNMGETPHAGLQTFFGWFFRTHQQEWRIEVFSEQRVQVLESRFRIPDVSVISQDTPYERIVRTPPLLCIEILSSEDRMREIQERLNDYARMGVQCSWVIDPWRGTAFAAGPDAILHEVGSHKGQPILAVPNTPISIAVDDIFAELERLEKHAASRPPER
jgi:Uma2 family endonuclease